MSPRADLGARRAVARLSGAAALLLSACGGGDGNAGPGGVTVGEARALEEAAEMLDESRPPRPAPAEKAQSGEDSVAASED